MTNIIARPHRMSIHSQSHCQRRGNDRWQLRITMNASSSLS